MPTFVVSLSGFTPGARYDGLPWTQARIEQGTTASGPWTPLEILALTPLDADPTNPATRNLTTTQATSTTGWFRAVFLDAAGHEQPSAAVFASPNPAPSAGEPVSTLLSQVLDEFGFDVNTTTALRWLNARHRQMVAQARYRREIVSVALTVADSNQYVFPAGLVEVYDLAIDGSTLDKLTRWEWRELTAGRAMATRGGWFVDANAAGTDLITLYPAPDTSGQQITVFAALMPQDLGLADHPIIPIDYYDALVAGTIATGLARDPEQIPVADRFEAQFAQAVTDLRRRSSRHWVGPGGFTAKIVGVTA